MANTLQSILLALALAIFAFATPAAAQANPCDCSFPCQVMQGCFVGPALS